MNILDSIADKLGTKRREAALSKQETAAQLKADFDAQIRNEQAGRKVDSHAVEAYLATVSDPEKTLAAARTDCENAARREELQRQINDLEARQADLKAERRELWSACKPKDHTLDTAGPLVLEHVALRRVIDEKINDKTPEDFAAWRAALRTCEDAQDSVLIIDQELRKTDLKLRRLGEQLAAIPVASQRFVSSGPATVVG